MITDIFGVITQAITSFGSALASAVTSITGMFYTPASTAGGSGEFTFLGYLMLISAGVAIVYWAFYLIREALHVGVK